MSTKKSSLARQNRLGSFENTEHMFSVLGIGLGSLIAMLSRKKSPFEYEDAIADLGRTAEDGNAAPELVALYRGALKALVSINQAALDMGEE